MCEPAVKGSMLSPSALLPQLDLLILDALQDCHRWQRHRQSRFIANVSSLPVTTAFVRHLATRAQSPQAVHRVAIDAGRRPHFSGDERAPRQARF